MTRITHPEWREQMELVRYPFADDTTLTASDGQTLLDETFLDAALYPVGGQPHIYLSQIVVDRENVTIWIGDETTITLASTTFNLTDPPTSLQLADQYGRAAGILVSEPLRLSIFQSWTQGIHSFTATATEFAVTVCMPTPEVGLRGILLDDGSLMTGDIWLVGDGGVVLTYGNQDVSEDCGSNLLDAIRVDIVGDPLFKRTLCTGDLFETPRFIKTVTFQSGNVDTVVTPDAMGNISIFVGNNAASDTVLRLHVTPGGLKFEAVGETI